MSDPGPEPIFVTNDRAMLTEGGVWDEVDHAAIDEMMRATGATGTPRLISGAEFMRLVAEGDEIGPGSTVVRKVGTPGEERAEDVRHKVWGTVGETPTRELLGLGPIGTATFEFYVRGCEVMVQTLPGFAHAVKDWRCEKRYTWRKIARAAAGRWAVPGVAGDQVFGMATCKAVAAYFGEDHEAPPWN